MGLMVLTDGMVHFLKIKNFFKQIYIPKLSCGFKVHNFLYFVFFQYSVLQIREVTKSLSYSTKNMPNI